GDKDLNSPRELTPEAEKELALVEKKVQDGHVDQVDPKLDCILVILPSRHSPTGILMQREDIILEWIFLPNKQSKKLKTYVEKISDLILKGKLRLHQLAGIDPAEIVVPLTKEEIEKLWAESEPWQRACSNFLGEINSKYPKSDRIELIKRADWILPRIVRETPISGVRTFYTDANKQGKAGYKSEDLSKVVQSPYNSVQKSELYAILLVLMDFSEPLNIVTDSQYAERVVLHIETAEFIPDESELTSLFIQLQDIIRNRKHPLYITHIRSHTGLPGPLAQGNDEIDKLLIGNVLEASEFHKKHHVNSKGLKRDFSITWQQSKEIVRKCPTCSFYNQTPLPAGCNPKGTQRNDIWQMDVFHFAEFGKLKYVHHTIDTYSGFQWATALSSEKADSVITHLLEVMAIMGIPAQIKTDNAPAYVSEVNEIPEQKTTISEIRPPGQQQPILKQPVQINACKIQVGYFTGPSLIAVNEILEQKTSISEVNPPGQHQPIFNQPLQINAVNDRPKEKSSISEAMPLKQMKSINKSSESVELCEEVDISKEQKSLSRLSEKPDPDVSGTRIKDNDSTSCIKKTAADQEKIECDRSSVESNDERLTSLADAQYAFSQKFNKKREGIESSGFNTHDDAVLPSNSQGITHSTKIIEEQEKTKYGSSSVHSNDERWMRLFEAQYAFAQRFKEKMREGIERSGSDTSDDAVLPSNSQGRTHSMKIDEDQEKTKCDSSTAEPNDERLARLAEAQHAFAQKFNKKKRERIETSGSNTHDDAVLPSNSQGITHSMKIIKEQEQTEYDSSSVHSNDERWMRLLKAQYAFAQRFKEKMREGIESSGSDTSDDAVLPSNSQGRTHSMCNRLYVEVFDPLGLQFCAWR
ncbi:hypothetical protein STEG23_026502, partial [Scotinomys teguina]